MTLELTVLLGIECYCGNTIRDGSYQVPDTDCGMTCGGNNTKVCGDNYRLSLYTWDGGSASPSSEYDYLGCYTDSTPRVLPNRYGDSQMTIEKCADWAKTNGYQIFGLEYGE